jgi:hypothetical protein
MGDPVSKRLPKRTPVFHIQEGGEYVAKLLKKAVGQRLLVSEIPTPANEPFEQRQRDHHQSEPGVLLANEQFNRFRKRFLKVFSVRVRDLHSSGSFS